MEVGLNTTDPDRRVEETRQYNMAPSCSGVSLASPRNRRPDGAKGGLCTSFKQDRSRGTDHAVQADKEFNVNWIIYEI